jgi:hypothetical protein
LVSVKSSGAAATAPEHSEAKPKSK